jgi:hypothetical protein
LTTVIIQRSVGTINDCLIRKHAELIGFGRPAILYPDLPHKVLDLGEFPPITDSTALPHWLANTIQVKLVGAGLDTAVWVRAMKRIARGDIRRLEGNALDAFLHLFFSNHFIFQLYGLILLSIAMVVISLSRLS